MAKVKPEILYEVKAQKRRHVEVQRMETRNNTKDA